MNHGALKPSTAGHSKLVPLTTLRGGERGRLHAANLCCEDCGLLRALGMTDQCELRVCRAGEPCIVQVKSTRLGIAASLARSILVTVDERCA
jgi:Fe2+ transport system protein FeoA